MAVAIRTGVAVAIIGLALSLLTCGFIVWRRTRKPKGLPLAVAVDTLLAAAFFMAPWLAIGLASGELPGDIISLWIRPGVAIRTLPCLCAAIAGLAFAGITRSKEPHF